jgi:Na+-driven multidrug efflux pump
VWVAVRAARRDSASLRPDLPGIRAAGRAGIPLIMRTLMLRASLLVMTYAAARLGEDDLAAMQLALTIWTFLAFTLDAVAIAAQAITGRYLGAVDAKGTRAVTSRMERWGWLSGVITGLALAGVDHVELRQPDPADSPVSGSCPDLRALVLRPGVRRLGNPHLPGPAADSGHGGGRRAVV